MLEAVLISGKPDDQKKSCSDCYWCQGAVSWWCKNSNAVKTRGTNIPGVNNCNFWKPCRTWKELSWFEKLFGSFVKIKGNSNDT